MNTVHFQHSGYHIAFLKKRAGGRGLLLCRQRLLCTSGAISFRVLKENWGLCRGFFHYIVERFDDLCEQDSFFWLFRNLRRPPVLEDECLFFCRDSYEFCWKNNRYRLNKNRLCNWFQGVSPNALGSLKFESMWDYSLLIQSTTRLLDICHTFFKKRFNRSLLRIKRH